MLNEYSSLLLASIIYPNINIFCASLSLLGIVFFTCPEYRTQKKSVFLSLKIQETIDGKKHMTKNNGFLRSIHQRCAMHLLLRQKNRSWSRLWPFTSQLCLFASTQLTKQSPDRIKRGPSK